MLALTLAAATAAAQEVRTPADFVDEAGLERFRQCRAAVFYHLDGEPDPESRVPRSVALTLLDQIDFIMAESLIGKPHGTMGDGQRLIRFAESWFLGFNRTIARTRDAFADPAARDRALIGCIPLVWSVARHFVEDLAAWRAEFDPTPPPPTPEAAAERQRDFERRLGMEAD